MSLTDHEGDWQTEGWEERGRDWETDEGAGVWRDRWRQAAGQVGRQAGQEVRRVGEVDEWRGGAHRDGNKCVVLTLRTSWPSFPNLQKKKEQKIY